MTDYISRADALVAVCKWCEHPYCEAKEKCGQWIAMTILPSAEPTIPMFTESAEAYKEWTGEDMGKQVTGKLENVEISTDKGDESTMSQPKSKLDHDREWIIGCIKHDGFIKTDRFDKANQIILEALSADAVQGYTEWLEKIIVDNEGANEWLCEDTPDLEWCEKNCHYSSIQAECLRHLYEVSKGGAE